MEAQWGVLNFVGVCMLWMRRGDRFAGNAGNISLISQLLYFLSYQSHLLQKQQLNQNLNFFELVAALAAHQTGTFFLSSKLKPYNICDELGPKELKWFHYLQRRYDKSRKWHLRNPTGAPRSAATCPAHLMESVRFSVSISVELKCQRTNVDFPSWHCSLN